MTLDTGPAKRPGLPALRTSDPALAKWAQVVAEHLEMHMGTRGNPKERAVTLRELEKVAGGMIYLQGDKRQAQPGDLTLDLGGGLTASVAIDQFIESIKNTRLFKDLIQRLDDPTRFDYLPEAVRNTLLRSISEEAAKRGADITRLETKIQNSVESLAILIQEVTAAVDGASSGVRELTFASAQANRAQAGKITQLEASLGNYYADGTPGRVILEQVLEVVADRVDGLRGQYTLKIQAGGALAGFGIAAEEINGQPSSAFIIAADKFAIVLPNYSGGLTNTPNVNSIPFGVDVNGIYLNNSVYIRGNIRVDTAGKRLIDGLRGSVNIASGGGPTWSDLIASTAVYQALGLGSGVAPNNNHLVIGDTVTQSGTNFVETRAWFGSSWIVPGAVINGNLLVNGSVAAGKIDTRGLTIRDAAGNVIFGAGAGLDVSRIIGLGSLATQNTVATGQVTGLGGLATQNNVNTSQVVGLGALATQNTVATGQVTGLGALATQNSALIGSTVRLPDGTVLGTADFVNRLSKINNTNISTFLETAAIGNAYIGNAAVGTLTIAGNAVTVPVTTSATSGVTGTGSFGTILSTTLTVSQAGFIFASASIRQGFVNNNTAWEFTLRIAGVDVFVTSGRVPGDSVCLSGSTFVAAGTHQVLLLWKGENANVIAFDRTLYAVSAMR